MPHEEKEAFGYSKKVMLKMFQPTTRKETKHANWKKGSWFGKSKDVHRTYSGGNSEDEFKPICKEHRQGQVVTSKKVKKYILPIQ